MTRRGTIPVAIWLVGVVMAIAIIARTPFAADMSAFLPRSADPRQQVLVDQLRDGVASRLILVGIGGAAPDGLATLSKDLAARLAALPDIGLVNNGDESGLKRDRDYLWQNRYLLSPGVTPARFTAEGLHEALETALGQLGTQMGLLLKRTLPSDPTGEMLRVIEPLDGAARPASYDGVWVSPDHARAILMVEARAGAYEIDAQEQALREIEAAFAAARAATTGAEKSSLTATGPPIFAIHSRAEIKGDAMRFSIIATALVAGLLVLAYRSALVLVLALLPVASGALAGIAAVGLGFGFVHGITLAFGVTLIGEAVDYAIYLFTQTAPGSPPRTTLARIWPTLRLGLLTSVFGFSAMLLSGFPGFVQLGLFTITGLTVAAFVTRFVLPALLPSSFAGARSLPLGIVLQPLIGHAPRLRLALAFCLALSAVTLALHGDGYWESELSSMNPVPAAELQLDQTLRKEMGAPDVRYMVMTETGDQQQTLAASAGLRAALAPLVEAGALDGIDAPDLYLPDEATQRARQAALPDPATLKANLDAALTGLPFKPDLFAPFLADAAAAKTAPLLTRASLAETSLALKLDALLIKRQTRWIAILPLQGVRDAARIEAALQAYPGTSLLDLKTESAALLSRYLREAQTLALLGGAAIILLLAVALRSPRRLRKVLAPLAAAVLLTTALLTLGGHKLSIFNLFGLLLTVAVGSNYCLFFERAEGEGADAARVMSSLVLANLCTVIGFGVLSFSRIPVLHGIGLTVAIGTILSLVTGAILTAPKAAA